MMDRWTRHITELVATEAGLDVSRCRAFDSSTILEGIAKDMGLPGPDDVLQAAMGPRRAFVVDRVLTALLVHETFFYRYKSQLQAIEQQFLPAVIAARPPIVRLWSAGCSTGPEAYTLAMITAEACERAGASLPIEVVGTDLSPASLDVATRGTYPASAAADLPRSLRERYLVDRGPDELCVVPDLAGMVRFRRHNLRDRPRFGSFHVICCRNVLMYLHADSARSAVLNLADALAPDGIIAVGHGESLRAFSDLLTADRKTAVNIYRKKAPELATRPALPRPVAPSPARTAEPALPPAPAAVDPVLRIELSGLYDARDAPDALDRLQSMLASAVADGRPVEVHADGADSLDGATARLILRASRLSASGLVVIASRPAARRWAERYGLPRRG